MPRLCVIPGDGIGREVVPVAVEVLQQVIPDLETVHAQAGWACFQEHGTSVPQKTLDLLQSCGAGLFGAVSSPSYKVEGYRSAILTMRQACNLYANIRPVFSLPNCSPLQGIDMVVVRENTEGLYAGREYMKDNEAIAERVITKEASRRIAEVARKLAESRPAQHLSIVHKANVLPVTDGLFRDSVRNVLSGSEVEVQEMLVDIAALRIISEPRRFDVIVTTNLFGDILSDAAAHWMGGLGLAPSVNLGDEVVLAEPVHGSAPDIAGLGRANPLACILSAAYLAEYAWNRKDAANQIIDAVKTYLQEPLPMLGSTQHVAQGIMSILRKQECLV